MSKQDWQHPLVDRVLFWAMEVVDWEEEVRGWTNILDTLESLPF